MCNVFNCNKTRKEIIFLAISSWFMKKWRIIWNTKHIFHISGRENFDTGDCQTAIGAMAVHFVMFVMATARIFYFPAKKHKINECKETSKLNNESNSSRNLNGSQSVFSVFFVLQSDQPLEGSSSVKLENSEFFFNDMNVCKTKT